GLDYRLGNLRLELAQVAIGDGGRNLDKSERVNERFRQGLAGNWEVLDRPLSLGAVVGLGGHLDFAHRVFFGTKIAHSFASGERPSIFTLDDLTRPGNCNGCLLFLWK